MVIRLIGVDWIGPWVVQVVSPCTKAFDPRCFSRFILHCMAEVSPLGWWAGQGAGVSCLKIGAGDREESTPLRTIQLHAPGCVGACLCTTRKPRQNMRPIDATRRSTTSAPPPPKLQSRCREKATNIEGRIKKGES
jgi:hypothetical protein